MKLIILYLLALITALLCLSGLILIDQIPVALIPYKAGLMCATIGGFGGCIYCLRSVYLNACVKKQWDADWHVWYYIRPLVSIACGAVSFLFLKAGLLVLESGSKQDSTDLGFYAFAFVAGLNVDKFIAKIEDIAQAAWGIEKSRYSSGNKE